jgi:acetyl esterase/lipase
MIRKSFTFEVLGHEIELYAYLEQGAHGKDSVLIFPGGGYEALSTDREGVAIANAYFERGLNAFVLHYSIKEKAVFPRSLCDVSLAVSYIRAHAKEFNINPNRVFVAGFSAGGHLAACLGTMWDLPEIRELTGIAYGDNKPSGVILGYALVSGKPNALQVGEAERNVITAAIAVLNGKEREKLTEEDLDRYSVENYVKAETAAPMFAFHTATDFLPVVNPIILGIAYANAGLPFELHVYPNGPHGLALANKATSLGNPILESEAVATWFDHSIEWMKNI